MSITIILTIRDETVTKLEVSISPENYRGPGIPRDLLAFSPERLVSQYGLPSNIGYGVFRIRDNVVVQRTWYGMVMKFEAVDLIVEYYSAEIFPVDSYQTCPLTDRFDSVHLWFGEDPEHPPFEGVPSEEATSLTIEEFVNLVSQDPESACFDLKVELFP